jgi:3-methyladenine DNA glycosylase AlkD
MMRAREARELGERIATLVRAGQIAKAYTLLAPVLAQRTPFDMLRRIGEPVGREPLEPVNAFLEHVAADRTEGGWVVIAKALEQQLARDLAGVFARCKAFIIAADVWYGADIMGEGVVGEALVSYFHPVLDLLGPWREDPNAWVRRSVGTGVHFWAKRSRGAAELTDQAETLLVFLEPMFGEWEMDVVKGVGWGLKTLGKHYPDLAADWLVRQISRRHRSLMLRKALTYLSDERRTRVTGEALRVSETRRA